MKIISKTRLAKEKVKAIRAGYTAYEETKEVTERIKKELNELGIDYIEIKSPRGTWFIKREKA